MNLDEYYASERDETRDEIIGAIPLDVTDAGHDGHAFAECWLTCDACDDEAGEPDDDDTHDASCWVTDRCVTCGECRHLCPGADVGGRVW